MLTDQPLFPQNASSVIKKLFLLLSLGAKEQKYSEKKSIFILFLVTFHTFHTNFWPKDHERGEQGVTQPECCFGCYR